MGTSVLLQDIAIMFYMSLVISMKGFFIKKALQSVTEVSEIKASWTNRSHLSVLEVVTR